MPKFLLEIEIGNDAMTSTDDIIEALSDVTEKIRYDGVHYVKTKIRDRNGNTVGHYGLNE